SATFAGGNTAVTNASGVATLLPTANSHAGGPYNVTAATGSVSVPFALTNTPGAAATMTITGGTGQTAAVSTVFASPLTATVTDSLGNPVPNALVTFVPPAQTGPSITFAGGVNTATTNASGVVTSAAITANSHAGPSYNVSASTGG